MKERIRTALEFLKDGQSFTVGQLMLQEEKSGVLEVMGWSQYINFANLTKLNCLVELQEIKALFFEMVDASSELKDYLIDKYKVFTLCFDDDGKCSIRLCSEQDKKIIWEVDIK